MKLEIKQFLDYYNYLTVYYKKDNEKNYNRLPVMLNIDLATKEDIINFLVWINNHLGDGI